MTASKRNTPTYDVLGIGCVAVDELLYIDAFPGEDGKQQILRSERQCGGLTATALVAAAKLGGRCAFGGLIGTDELSSVVEDNFRRHGVDVSHAVHTQEAGPIHAFIVVAERGHTRTIFFDANAATGAPPNGPNESAVRAARVLLIDDYGHEGNLKALEVARDSGVEVVADFERNDSQLFPVLVDEVGHLVVSQGFALRTTGAPTAEAATHALWTESRAAVVITCGSDGAWYKAAPGEGPRHVPAFRVPVVDTTGCGDVFHGAYALALARGWSIEKRVRYAEAAAALKAGRAGGQSGSPNEEELTAFMKENYRR